MPAEDVLHVYVFTGWDGEASETGLTSDPILMDGPKTAMAVWEKRLSSTFYIVIGTGIIAVAVIVLIILSNRYYMKRKVIKK